MISSPIFTTSLSAEEITLKDVLKYIQTHNTKELPRLKMLEDYYDGNHSINKRQKAKNLSNNIVVTNHASYIANFTAAYLAGEAVTYTAPDEMDITAIQTALKKADSATQDADLALDCAIFGRCYDMTYMSGDENAIPKLARLSPMNTFVVYDDTVEQKPVFAVYYYPVLDDSGNVKNYNAQYYTDTYSKRFALSSTFGLIAEGEPELHYFGMVPINEIYNNGRRTGDFEQVISLIDAYNTLQSDRINDKEQFVDAILYLKGTVLGDDNEERSETYKAIKDLKVMELPADGEAGFLTRQFDETSVEVLKNAIVNDIHKTSCVPDMTDDNFAGNASGVAMKYKLIGLEQLTKTKERYFAEGLKYRLKLFANVLSVKGMPLIDTTEISIKFRRSLPVNELETAQVVSTLNGTAPLKELLSLLPFIDDADKAMKQLEEEQKNKTENAQAMFMNTPIGTNEEE